LNSYGAVTTIDSDSTELLPEEKQLADYIVTLASSGTLSRLVEAGQHYKKMPGDPSTHYEGNLALSTAMSFARHHCANRRMAAQVSIGARLPMEANAAKELASHLSNYVHAVNTHVQSLSTSDEQQEREAQERGSRLGQHLVEQLGKSVPLAAALNDLVALTQTRITSDPADTRVKLAAFWNSPTSAYANYKVHAAEHFK
jgi:hypothetical protein